MGVGVGVNVEGYERVRGGGWGGVVLGLGSITHLDDGPYGGEEEVSIDDVHNEGSLGVVMVCVRRALLDVVQAGAK